MSDYKLTPNENDILKVLKNEIDNAKNTPSLKPAINALDYSISTSEELLRSLGLGDELAKIKTEDNNQLPIESAKKKKITIRPFEELLHDANEQILYSVDFSDIFTADELFANREIIESFNADFNAIHRLDSVDWAICIVAGLIAAAVDILLVGIPEKTVDGAKAGPLSNWIRNKIDLAIPPDRIKELEDLAKVPYDPSMNVNNQGNPITAGYVDGLTPYFHRLVSLGHDPLLGLVFGVLDVIKGSLTTIDRKGKIVRLPQNAYFAKRHFCVTHCM